jgi:hypothetical protein
VTVVVDAVVVSVTVRPVTTLCGCVLARQPLLLSSHHQRSDSQYYRCQPASSRCIHVDDQSAQPSPYILWKSRIPRRLPANLPPRHCTRPRGSAPRTDASGVVWNVGSCVNSVRTRVTESCVHTPLVIGKVRFTRLFYVNAGVHAPYHSSSKVNRLTVYVKRFS